MAQPKPYNYYLRKWDGIDWYYYEIVAGALFENISIVELQRAPDGWKDNKISFERGFTYFSLFTAFSTPLKFIKDGAQILRNLMFNHGIEANVQILIEKLNVSTYLYETWFAADLDMSKSTSEFDYVITNAIEGGFVAKLKAREDTPYEIDLEDNADVEYVEHDGRELQSKLLYTAVTSSESDLIYDEIPILSWYITEGTNVSTDFYDVSPTSPIVKIHIKNKTASTIDYTHKLIGSYEIDPNGSYSSPVGYFTIRFFEYNAAGVFVVATDIYIHGVALPTGGSTTYNVDFTTSS